MNPRLNLRRKPHSGLSLMEMVLATALLASSGVALFTLVGQATQLARRAEERTVALQMAQSTMDEFLATGSNSELEMEGSFPSDPRWRYRIELSDVEATDQSESKLKRIVVSIDRTNERGGTASDTAVVSLVRWTSATKPPRQSPNDSVSPESSDGLPPDAFLPDTLSPTSLMQADSITP
ncbi:hypothetical protein RISK_002372 [Rhodopirellula islandica]|uniref:Uncharacterized protein n=1 Tax=Rhodopirellula islandica TaxID=595434 RepID=A0A0J1BGS6_RHOIS|nr:hypothetical protein [Rhodopirellula islandica]KLU05740.1 hypothetical protein RISK_002372 [Rhodopirellula islandica]